MSSPTSPVLEQHIAQLEAQLAQLKKEQTLLQNLRARKEDLQKELHRVNAQIAKVTSKVAPPSAGNTVPAAKATPTPPAAKVAKPVSPPAKVPASPAAVSSAAPSLADLIVACLKAANGKPVGVKQLTDETLKRGFRTTSSTPYRIVESRIQDLSKKGVVAHAKGQPGWVLGKAAPAAKPPAATPMKHGATKSVGAKPGKNGVAKVAPYAKKDNTPAKPPLREHVVIVLKRSKGPMSLKELSQKILAGGYKTGSTDFANVLGGALKKMKDVKRVPGKGYELKGAKS
jgi:hypothetical protein